MLPGINLRKNNMAKKDISPRWKLNKVDAEKIIVVALYSLGSTLCVTLVALIPTVEVPVEWMWLIPVVNTLAVTLKKWFEDRS